MKDLLTAWLRTVVPVLWSAIVAWLVVRIPPIGAVADKLDNLGVTLMVPIVTAAVYTALRWLQSRIPPWLARILMGSDLTPIYNRVGPDGTPIITTLEGRHELRPLPGPGTSAGSGGSS